MSEIYTDPPQSRNEAIIRATIDGTRYTAPPQSRMEDLLLELKEAIEQGGETKDYEALSNKPSINDVELSGNKTSSDLGLMDHYDIDEAPTEDSENLIPSGAVWEANQSIEDKLQGSKTATGNPITITDAEPMNAESVVVELEPKQDLHGYDAPWVGGAGKNKLPLVLADIKTNNTEGTWSGNTYTLNGVTFEVLTDSAGNVTEIVADGTSTQAFNFSFTDKIEGMSGSKYNGAGAGTTNNKCLIVGYWNTPTEFVTDGRAYGGNDYTLLDYPLMSFGIFMQNAQTLTNESFYPMIRLSTESDDSFEPYSNICPITGYSEVNVDRVGKNLFDKNQTFVFNGFISSDGTLTSSVAWWTTDYQLIKSGTYALSGVLDGMSAYYGICWYDENKNFIDGFQRFTTESASVNIPNNAKYIRYSVNEEAFNTFQLELGNQATTYEPYQGSTATIDLGGTKYGGTLDVTEGGFSDEWGYISGSSVSDLTSLGATTGTTGGGLFYISFGDIGTPTSSDTTPTRNVLQSNELDNKPANYIWEENTSGITSDNQGYIYFVVKDITTQADMDTWLSNNPIQIAYRKKTPSSISTTPTDIPLLENTNNISTDGTNITLKYQPNNVIGECKVYTDEQCAKVLPPLPTTDGTYHLECSVSGGIPTITWVANT